MKVAVIGSRSFSDKNLLYITLDNLREKVPSLESITLIISGGAKGADSLSEEYARDRNIETKIFLPEYNRYGRGAPLKRNLQIVENSDIVVAFWDSTSAGTRNAIDHAKKLKRELLIIEYITKTK